MLASLPCLAFALVAAALGARGQDKRAAVLHAAVAMGAVAVVLTEVLSAPRWLTRQGLAISWLVVAGAALTWLVHSARTRPASAAPPPGERPGLLDRGLVALTALLLAAVGAVAVLCPPNSWDVMQYHLPRVVHWIQNKSAAFYPTQDLKQLHMPPGAEFLVLQFHALAAGDRFDNLVQWSAMVGSVVGVSALARALGAGVRGQVLAAVVCATIPEGVLAGSGSKNDWVLALWLVALAYDALAFARAPKTATAAGIGAALGLAWLTKGTGYFFAPPILAVLWLSWPRSAKVAVLRHAPLIAVLALGLNAGHFARNAVFYGTPLGPSAEDEHGVFKYTNDVISLPVTVSNALRQAALHVRSEHRARNAVLEGWIRGALDAIDVDADDRRTNFFSFEAFKLPEVGVHEGFAGNPAHLVLLLAALIALVARFRRPAERPARVFALALVVAFLGYCALVRWQPLGARLDLPLFVLWSAPIGVVVGGLGPPALGRAVAVALLALAVPAAIGNESRPLTAYRGQSVLGTDRAHLYFGDRPSVAEPYLAAAALVRRAGCRDVALALEWDVGLQYEYAWLALLGAGRETRVRHVGVANPSTEYARAVAAPCVIVCPRCARIPQLWEQYGGDGAAATAFDDVVVFFPGRAHYAGRRTLP